MRLVLLRVGGERAWICVERELGSTVAVASVAVAVWVPSWRTDRGQTVPQPYTLCAVMFVPSRGGNVVVESGFGGTIAIAVEAWLGSWQIDPLP